MEEKELKEIKQELKNLNQNLGAIANYGTLKRNRRK